MIGVLEYSEHLENKYRGYKRGMKLTHKLLATYPVFLPLG
jgi:hypothetical protein